MILSYRLQRRNITLNPFNPDTDGDGLLDSWEVHPIWPGAGFNLNRDHKIEAKSNDVFGPYKESNSEFADKNGRVASPYAQFVNPPNPFRKDVYLEIDWQDCRLGRCPHGLVGFDNTHHAPSLEGLANVKNIFAQAPVTNPNTIGGINFNI